MTGARENNFKMFPDQLILLPQQFIQFYFIYLVDFCYRYLFDTSVIGIQATKNAGLRVLHSLSCEVKRLQKRSHINMIASKCCILDCFFLVK